MTRQVGQEGEDRTTFGLPFFITQAWCGQGPGGQRACWQEDSTCQTPSYFPEVPGSPESVSTLAGTLPSWAPTSAGPRGSLALLPRHNRKGKGAWACPPWARYSEKHLIS